jgi:hypothetical protein
MVGLRMVVTPTTRTGVPIIHHRGRRAIKVGLLVVLTQYILKSITIQTASSPNGQPMFPPPSIHPAMMQPPYLPPGSRIRNVDSFNTRNEYMNNVHNDNSTEYGSCIFVFSQALSAFLKIIQVFLPLVDVERIDDDRVCCMFTITANLLVDSYKLDREASGRRRRRRRRGDTTTAFSDHSQST